MIAQFKVIGSVKKLREEKAMRALEAARTALEKAVKRAEELAAEVAESERTLPEREIAVYEKVLKKIVGMGALDDAKDQVLKLLSEHQKLIDRLDRAQEHVIRCQDKLKEARIELRKRQADVEKIETITAELVREAEEEQIAKEEGEIEDLFAKPVRRADAGIEEHAS